MTIHDDSDNLPTVPPSRPRNLMIHGVELKLDTMRQSHPGGVTPTTIVDLGGLRDGPRVELGFKPRNAKLTRPAEKYPGEAEKMIDTWSREAVGEVQRARDATTGPALVSHLEAAHFAIGEALRWSKP